MNPPKRTLCVAFVLAACSGAAACTAARAARERDAQTSGRPPVAVTVAPAAAATIVDAVDVVGSLAPKFSAAVKSEVTGVVSQVYVTDWVAVRKGTPLARLDTSETEAAIEALNATEAQARVMETRASREHDRAVQLEEYGLITAQALDDATTALEAARTATAAAQAQIRAARARLAKSFISAPMDGVVADRRVSVGDRVENMGGNDPMFRIVDNRVLDLTVTVPSSRLGDVRVGQTLSFATDAIAGRAFTGTVTFVNPAVDEASRSAKVVATVQNADGALRGGLFARGRIVVSERSGVLQVARESLLNWDVSGRGAELFVVTGDTAKKRQVRTGATTDGLVEIVDGLHAGERVVVRGAFALRPEDKVAVAGGDAGVRTGE